MNAGAKFLLGQAALVEELGEQGVIRFGDVLDQFAVQPGDRVLQLALGRLLGEFAVPVGGVIGDDLVAQDVEGLVEAGAGIDGKVQRKNAGAVMLAQRGQLFVKVAG